MTARMRIDAVRGYSPALKFVCLSHPAMVLSAGLETTAARALLHAFALKRRLTGLPALTQVWTERE
jgi:hypothetical protein